MQNFTTSQQAREYFTTMTVKAIRAEARERGIAIYAGVKGHAAIVEHMAYWTAGRQEDCRAIAGR